MPKNYDLFLKGEVGGWDFSSDFVNYVLDKHKDAEVNVLVNSLGGYTHEGLAISSLFKIHGNVHVHYVGMNASAATIAAMGAKRITIDADACFLVHKCMNLVFEWDYLNADELDAHIKDLEKMKNNQQVLDGCVAGLYAKRCKKTKEELLELMSKDTWLSAQEALEWGFVDEITDDAEDKQSAVLSDVSVASLSAAGIPLPPNYRGKKKGSVLERFVAALQSAFTNQAPDTVGNDTEGAAKSSPIMAKLAALSALLGATLALSDNKLTLSAEQVDKVNDTLDENKQTIANLTASVADKDKEIERLTASIAEKDKTISDLRKEPAAPTSSVVDDKKDAEDPYAPVSEADALAVSKAFLSSF